MTSKQKQEFALRITQANKTTLSVILYEMLLQYIEDAAKAHEDNNRESFRYAIQRAQSCNHELTESLHLEYGLAKNLLGLYVYVAKELARADCKNELQPLNHAKMVILNLHEAYSQVSKDDKSSALMDNTQTIYAGLTYGRNDLTESSLHQGGNRGICI